MTLKELKKMIEITNKEQRGNYPNLKSEAELKKQNLMPKNHLEPDGVYKWNTTCGIKTIKLYDIRKAKKMKLSPLERLQAKRKKEKAERLKKAKKLNKELFALSQNEPKRFIVLDLETTGLDREKDEILQISIIDGSGATLYNSYVKPNYFKSWDKAAEINGITPEMVQGCRTIEQQRKAIQKILFSADTILTYNGIYFDLPFLQAKGFCVPEDAKLEDLMPDFAEVFGEWDEIHGSYKWQRLTKCAAYYGYEFKAHDSLEDCKATLYCYKKMHSDIWL